MRTDTLLARLRSERGIALPTALIALVLLTTLLIAFAVLSKSEPTIASNQARAAQARALAEAGAERALWALTSTVIPNPIAGSVATAPYDGSQYLALGTLGGFFVTVKPNPTASNQTLVDAVGYVPTYSTTALGVAHKHVHLVLTTIKWLNPPSALAVAGNLAVSGAATVDGSLDTSCGNKAGTVTTGTVTTSGSPTIAGITPSPGNSVQDVPSSVFNPYLFANSDIDMLRSLAKANGTYFTGNQTFNSSNPWPTSGIVFVDTTTGTDISCTAPGPGQVCTPGSSSIPTVTISGSGTMPVLNGWLIVNGSISWSGNATVNGMVYSVNDISMTGTLNVSGAVISANIINTSSTSIDSSTGGHANITYNCSNAKTGGGTIPTGWFVKQGSYREVSD